MALTLEERLARTYERSKQDSKKRAIKAKELYALARELGANSYEAKEMRMWPEERIREYMGKKKKD